MAHTVVPLEGTPPGVKLFYIKDILGLGGDQSRKDFRKLLKDLLKSNGLHEEGDYADLLLLPQHSQVAISLSHCRDAGLIGWATKPSRLGVDVEQWERISEVIINRVAPAAEVAACPQPRLLWSAKESVFKSQSDTVKLISSVEVFDWQVLESNRWSFRARLADSKENLTGRGEIRLIEGHSVAFFLTDH